MKGDKAFRIKKSEYNSRIFRRSIFSTQKIIKGEKFSVKNIETFTIKFTKLILLMPFVQKINISLFYVKRTYVL